MARLKQTPREVAEKVAAALLMISPENPAAVAGLYTGWTIPANYQTVRDCLKELRIDPYQDYGRIALRDVILKYWYWIASIALLLALMAGIIICLRRTKIILENEVNARQKTEAVLQFDRAQFLSIFNSVEGIVFVSDPRTYEIIFTNKYFQELLGKNPLGGVCYREF
jgi:PAS domain-containing protein